ncbi:adventurous gliding motility protein CglE [Vulgatibacter incomptus]|uniref:Outer membrane protein beta-barrel domain-containing protein n=1 Tax=Vulgatibacter incomptus TaxID=1391653 RepID=A0A0K1PCZ1_9BACT|nr:adventurous gliding motility protein CglE [Vulgatibacter incomptus]AKU91266.1 hypothetical protein AKJ08_1653 [Vulgatibacter incomptus]
MRLSLALAACLGSLSAIAVAIPAHAQVQGDRPGLTYREVERGPWVGSSFGAVYYFNLPGEGAPSGVGSLFGLEAGYDVSKFLQLGVVIWGQSVGAPSTYRAITDDALNPKRARGDFQTMMAGASLRLAFLRFQDDNGQDRTFVYARAAGGPTLSRPIGIVDEQGFFAAGGLGVEYFTRLRHFSVGIELDGMALLGDAGNAVGMAVLPHAKYTF